VILKIYIVLIFALILSGCMTSYDIRVCHQDTQVCSEVNVKSYREFSQPNVYYSRDGNGATFTFGAEAVTVATSPVEQAVADVIRATPSVILPVPQ
jgi:hypothetical protein